MNAGTIAAVIVAWVLGVLGVVALWPRTRGLRADAGVILPLGLGVGLGVTSVGFFLASLVTTRPGVWAGVVEGLAIAGLAVAVKRGRRGVRGLSETRRDASSTTGWVVGSLFLQAGVVAAVAGWRAWAAEPWGGWDAWAIWNMRARFIFRGGVEWTEGLRFSEIGWSHLDYPLLVPASVARVWAWGGAESAAAAGVVSGLFGGATVALLVGAVARLRGAAMGWIGGLALVGMPFFVTFSANQHADIPLGFFLLAAVAMVALSGREPETRGWPALAGVAAGLAAWTKNEGLLFAAIVAVAWAAREWRRGERRAVWAMGAGLGAALVPVIFFKVALAPGNDLVSGELGGRLGQLFSPARHAEILAALWRDGRGFGEWGVAPFAVMALALAAPGARRLVGRERGVVWTLGLTFAGYYAVYLITPWDLAGHLASSLPRLLVQLWPAGVLWWCLLAGRTMEGGADDSATAQRRSESCEAFAETNETLTRSATGRRGRAFVMAAVAVNVVVALAIGGWLARGLAPGEEAAGRIAGGA